MRYLQPRLLCLEAARRLYAHQLSRMSDVDFEAELAAWHQLEEALRPWLDTLTPRELEVLARTGDKALVEAMVQARSDG